VITVTAENWQQDANCADVPPDLMQPEVASDEDVRLAKSTCTGCPVMAQCLELAKSQTDPYGVHAGRWFGHKPAPVVCCTWCGDLLTTATRSTRSYCNDTCRKRASRAAARTAA